MAYEFVQRADGMVMSRLDPQEKAIIAQVAEEVADLIRADLGVGQQPEAVREAAASDDPLSRLEAEFAGTAHRAPRDSAVQRLFPEASTDPEIADEMRRLGQQDLADAKLRALAVVQRSIDAAGPLGAEIVLSPDQATAWLTGLNDMRLVLADRLALSDDEDIDTLRMLQQIAEDAGIDETALDRAAGSPAPDDAGEADEEEGPTPAAPDLVLAVYDLLTWLQDSLVRAVTA